MTKGLFRWNFFCCGRYYSAPVVGEEKSLMKHSPIKEDRLSKMTQRYYHVPKGIVQENNLLEVFEEVGGNFTMLRILFVS